MLIVIEGCDKSGKSTLAKAVATTYSLEYKHFGPPKTQDPAKEYVEFLQQAAAPVVCDRFYLGELVYGPLLRQREMKRLDQVTLERLCRRHWVRMVLTSLPLDIVTERALGTEEFITPAQNTEAYLRFKQVYEQAHLGLKGYYDGRVQLDLTDMVKRLGAFLKPMLSLASRTHGFSGIGTVEGPALVLVGDQVNPGTTRFGLPFDAGPSAEFLQHCLEEAGVDEDFVYVTNQATLTDREADYHYKIGSHFVALGNQAAEKLKDLGIKHQPAPHPQYWRRFHSAEWGQYRDLLKGAWQRFQAGDKPLTKRTLTHAHH